MFLVLVMVIGMIPFSALSTSADATATNSERAGKIVSLEITIENYEAGKTVGDLVITDNSDLTYCGEFGMEMLGSNGIYVSRLDDGASTWVSVTDLDEPINPTSSYNIRIRSWYDNSGVYADTFLDDRITVKGAYGSADYFISGDYAYLNIYLSPATYCDSVAFVTEGYEVGNNITDVKVTTDCPAITLGNAYGTDFGVLDMTATTIQTGGLFAKNTVYTMMVNFKVNENTAFDVNSYETEDITLDGMSATTFSYDESSGECMALFYLPILEHSETPIEKVELDLTGYGYGKPANGVVISKINTSDPFDAGLLSIVKPDGSNLTGSDTFESYDVYKLTVMLMPSAGYSFESLELDDVTLDGISASGIAHMVLSGNYLAVLTFDLPYVWSQKIDSIALELPEPEEGEDITLPKVFWHAERTVLDNLVRIDDASWTYAEKSSDNLADYTGSCESMTKFEMGYSYLLSASLSCEYMEFAENCKIWIMDPEYGYVTKMEISELNSDGGIDFSYKYNDLDYEVIREIEISTAKEIQPTTGAKVSGSDAFTVVSVNGKTAEKEAVSVDKVYWYFNNSADFENSGMDYLQDEFLGGYYYDMELEIHRDSSCSYFADTVKIIIKTPTKTYEHTIEADENDYSIYPEFVFDKKTEGEPPKEIGDITIKPTGHTLGGKIGDIGITVEGEGIESSVVDIVVYNVTDDREASDLEIFEAGKVYTVSFMMTPKEGYSIVKFDQDYSNISFVTDHGTYNGVAKLDYAPYSGQVLWTLFTLPILGENSKPIGKPTMSLNNYELGKKASDVTVNFECDGLIFVPGTEAVYVNKDFDFDRVIGKDDRVLLSMRLNLKDGYSFEGINKAMFAINGIAPKDVLVVSGMMGPSTVIMLAYELPTFHEHTSDWKTDATSHWNECACGDKANVAPHADANNDEKCDVCSYTMPKVEENDPSAPTPDIPNTNTDKPTDATESEKDDSTETEAPTDNGCGGCGSSAALSAIAIVGMIGTAIVLKKKED